MAEAVRILFGICTYVRSTVEYLYLAKAAAVSGTVIYVQAVWAMIIATLQQAAAGASISTVCCVDTSSG